MSEDIEEIMTEYAPMIKEIVARAMDKHWYPQIQELRKEQREDVQKLRDNIIAGLDPEKTYSYTTVTRLVDYSIQRTSAIFGLGVLFDEINS